MRNIQIKATESNAKTFLLITLPSNQHLIKLIHSYIVNLKIIWVILFSFFSISPAKVYLLSEFDGLAVSASPAISTESCEKTVDVHVNRLRKKLLGNKEFEITTIRNIGYKAVIKKQPKYKRR